MKGERSTRRIETASPVSSDAHLSSGLPPTTRPQFRVSCKHGFTQACPLRGSRNSPGRLLPTSPFVQTRPNTGLSAPRFSQLDKSTNCTDSQICPHELNATQLSLGATCRGNTWTPYHSITSGSLIPPAVPCLGSSHSASRC